MVELSRGAALFRAEIERREITAAAAAAALSLSPSTVHHYTVTGVYRPRQEIRERIEKWSAGKVPTHSWDERPGELDVTDGGDAAA